MVEEPTRQQAPSLGRPGARIVAGRPPFAFALTAPAGWVVLPGERRALTEALVAQLRTAPGWARLPSGHRSRFLGLIGDLAAMAASAGTVANFLHLDPHGWDPARPDHVPAVCHLSLAWMKTAPMLADLDLARLVAGEADLVETVDLPAGPGLIRGTVTEHGHGAASYSVDAYVPIPGSLWMAVLAGFTTDEAQVEFLESAVRSTAATLSTEHRKHRRHRQPVPEP